MDRPHRRSNGCRSSCTRRCQSGDGPVTKGEAHGKRQRAHETEAHRHPLEGEKYSVMKTPPEVDDGRGAKFRAAPSIGVAPRCATEQRGQSFTRFGLAAVGAIVPAVYCRCPSKGWRRPVCSEALSPDWRRCREARAWMRYPAVRPAFSIGAFASPATICRKRRCVSGMGFTPSSRARTR